MSSIGLSVPPGFTLTTECCSAFSDSSLLDSEIDESVWQSVREGLAKIEGQLDAKFGSGSNPLLLSV